MTRARRLILAGLSALALLSSVAAAFAQVPGPVPALPDSERRTSYSISASTCGCAVGFQLFGDSNDFANWLEVFVNGVRVPQAGNWTIASPSGSLATLPRPISDAVLTFITAQTGTVQIVGARRPRRTSQFQESQPVPTRNFNVVVSDLTAQNREVWDKLSDVTGRVPQAPPGETLALLPVLASRANMNACFDSGGNLTSCVGASSGSFAAGNGILFTGTNPTTISNNIQAGAGITFTGTNPIIIKAGGANGGAYVLPGDYNFTCDGVTDFATQLQAMITGSAGKTIFIPPGPDCLTSATLILPSNTTITGGGREVSVIRGTGNANPVLSATNQSNISLSNFWLKGSDSVASWSVSSFGALKFSQNGSAIAAGTNYNIQNMKFSGFNASYWIYFDSVGSTFALNNITFANNYILSALADVPTDATPGNNNNYGLVIFSGSAGNGRVENTLVKNNRVESTGICFPLTLFSNQYKFQINENIVLSPGAATSGHCVSGTGTINAYGILVYDLNGDGNPPTNGLVEANTIINPIGAGIYFAGDGNPAHLTSVYNSSRSVISSNLIEGQSSQDDASLPRGAIVLNSMTDISVIGNKMFNGFGGVVATSQNTGIISIAGNDCFSFVVSLTSTTSCIRLGAGLNGSSNTSKHIVKANYLELGDITSNGGSVVRSFSLTGARFGDVEISDNTINAGWSGLSFVSQFVAGAPMVKNNKFGGVSNNYMMNVAGLTGTPVAIIGNAFDSIAGVNGNALLTSGSVNHMIANKFMNRASGSVAMYSGVGACGTIMGTQFNNVVQAAQVAASSLGLANPSGCTLNYLDQVQNLTPSELGSAASKYVVDHWSHVATSPSTTHLEQRQLTGN